MYKILLYLVQWENDGKNEKQTLFVENSYMFGFQTIFML